jgi:hypothetical protein
MSTRTYVTFANPYLRCDECGEPVRSYWHDDTTNRPCGHRGVTSACPSWGPVDGCSCVEQIGHRPHADETPGTGEHA